MTEINNKKYVPLSVYDSLMEERDKKQQQKAFKMQYCFSAVFII